MPLRTFQVYRTTVVNGVATVSEPFTLTINDAEDPAGSGTGDGLIDRSEWNAYTGGPNGHIGGTTGGTPALWDGDTGTLNANANGYLYTTMPISTTAPDNQTEVQEILGNVIHGPGYAVDMSVCYLAGTMIQTPEGPKRVETLRIGDLVTTKDHGPQPLVWTSASRVTGDVLDRAPNRRPIRIEAGALGDGLPRRAVDVSAQHRVLVRHEGQEYLISARHLLILGMPGISARRGDEDFTLVHIAFADHQIVLAEGAEMESFYTGPMAVRALGAAQRMGLMLAFPALARGENPMTPARPFIRHSDYRQMLEQDRALAS